jgi:glycosyltransferase involved in cell wall biosynthesis
MSALPSTVVVNFNAPELHQLALALARAGALQRYVRPYVNKGRGWERALAGVPLAGRLYATTFGRRLLEDPRLAQLTHEAGVLPDVLAATAMRLHLLPDAMRRRWVNALIKVLREAVADTAVPFALEARCVVAYEGFALPAFLARRDAGGGRAVLNYPVAHHRVRRRERLEEIDREPSFASTWPDFDDWPAGHERRLDDEIQLADAVLVGSTYAADSFVAEGIPRSRMRVVPYGVDLQTFAPPADGERERRDGPRFETIFSGQMTQRKGLSYLLRGWRRFGRPDARLTIVGAPVGDPRALAPYADSFRHVPHQTRPELARLYRAADVFVFPTLLEGMGLVVLEAMACGLPVIVTANGPGDLVRDGIDGFVIPTRDADAIADRLERLYQDRALREEMGRNAAQRAAGFGWSAYTDKVQACLAGLFAPGQVHEGAQPAAEATLMPAGASPAA